MASPPANVSLKLTRPLGFTSSFPWTLRCRPGLLFLRSPSKRSLHTRSMAPELHTETRNELAKSFDFSSEERIYNWWESQGYFKPSSKKDCEPFVIAMPPANVTGALHMGHAMFVTLEDVMIRHWRMRGKAALWIPGTDHAGIATQLVVEKMLLSQGVKRSELGREQFVARVWEWKKKFGGTITNQLRRLGASCDWTRERFTLDRQLSDAVVEAFLHLHRKGLIYRGSYMVNWSPSLQTAVSDLEVEYSEEPGSLYFFKYPIADGGRDDYLPIATTRPETLLGDTAVAVHPEDERYAKYVGRMAIVPMSNGRKIPVIADKYVKREFGTGALKITPGHDPNDYEIGKKFGLPIINIMNNDGSMNENAGNYSGLDRFEARKKLWEDLEAAGLAIKIEPYTLNVPRSQRGGEIVEPLVSMQWFVKIQPLAKKALEAVEEGHLKIIPERFEKTYNHWLSNIKDWCISRQLWWGHRIPVWYVKGIRNDEYIVARTEEDAYVLARKKFGDDCILEQDPDVLDTWFSSGLWPFSTLGWPDTTQADYARFYPTAVMETGHDILFFWVARMVMMGIEFTGKLPFSTIYLHGLVRDSQGRKMSKTLGNVIDPLQSIAEYGTDALRFTLATGTTPGQDVNLSPERLTANKGFTNKLWNAGKFIHQNLPPPSDELACRSLSESRFISQDDLHRLPQSEQWILSKLHALVDDVTTNYEKLYLGEAGRAIYDFFWSDFADWYIEASKTRLYQHEYAPSASIAQSVLLYVFNHVLRLLHPFMPYVTEELWQGLFKNEGALIVSPWPTCNLPKNQEAVQNFEIMQILIRSIRNARAEYSVEPGKRITAILVTTGALQLFIEAEKAILFSLAKLDPKSFQLSSEIPDDANKAIQLVICEGLEVYLPLSEMVDIENELLRLGKQVSKMQLEFDGLSKRLSSSNFVEKAPAAVVQETRQKAEELQEKLLIIKQRVTLLESMAVAPARDALIYTNRLTDIYLRGRRNDSSGSSGEKSALVKPHYYNHIVARGSDAIYKS
ncbi:hypothetical protein GOP47_0019772 [Adiantum capillus-veneris]|uniref:valine--tRNA ligase n=1 Tax=Adiantum capillus-veneris TaxID=13818 RepID=A0A9D4Z8X9_ADICA|nr:hypothetical protein GOP47_0019772 [Adiantum capillus-veneris]